MARPKAGCWRRLRKRGKYRSSSLPWGSSCRICSLLMLRNLLMHCCRKILMIEFEHVCKQYEKGITALSDLSLSIAKGELIYLAGPSGAGKSTLLKLIAAIERPSSGKLLVNGQNIGLLKASGLPYLRRKLGLILQQQRLLFDRNVLANVMLPMIVSGFTKADSEKRSRAALDKVGLLDKA